MPVREAVGGGGEGGEGGEGGGGRGAGQSGAGGLKAQEILDSSTDSKFCRA